MSKRDGETFYRAPAKNPKPENKKTLDGSYAERGYEVLSRADRGGDRKPLAQRDYANGAYRTIDYIDS